MVCPSGYDLGQDYKVVVLSVPEGNDKIPKYPVMFRRTDLTIVNKIDILPYVSFDLVEAARNLKEINPQAQLKALSAKTGEGMEEWIDLDKGRLSSMYKAIKVIVRGKVQGVGFRPFIYSLSKKYHLNGTVQNNLDGVIILAQGEEGQLGNMVDEIRRHLPKLANIQRR